MRRRNPTNRHAALLAGLVGFLLMVPQACFSPALADGWHSPPFISSPLDFWRRNKERLGFSEGARVPDPKAKKQKLPEIDDLDAAERRYASLLKKARETRDPGQLRDLRDQIRLLREAITAYRVEAGFEKGGPKRAKKRSGQQKRRAFVHQMIATMAYVNDDNIAWSEFPVLMSNRDRYMKEIVQVMKEIGPEAAPQLMEHLRAELALSRMGRTAKDQVREQIKEILKQITGLRAQQSKVRDKGSWDAVEREIQRLNARIASLQTAGKKMGAGARVDNLSAPLPAYRGSKKSLMKSLKERQGLRGMLFDSVGFVASKDFVELLSQCLLAIGPRGLKHWVQGARDLNPIVREHVHRMIKSMGAAVVPPLIEELKNAKDPKRRRDIVAGLSVATGEKFGDDVAKYEEWWQKKRPMALPQPRDKVPEAPPAPPVQGDDDGEDELIIGPRKE